MIKIKLFLVFFGLSYFSIANAQFKTNFLVGEELKYKVSYSIFNAAYATIKINETKYNNIPHFHVVGQGNSSGALNFFCKIDDKYETLISKETLKPSKFIRKVSECGYHIDVNQLFDFSKKEVEVIDFNKNTKIKYKINEFTQDLISALYYLRNIDKMEDGQLISLDIFIDNEIFPFKLKILKREIIKTKFGKVQAIKAIPFVQNGRIFKEKEGVILWISDDQNRLPLKIQAELMVGSIKVNLEQYKNIKYPLNKK